MSFLKIENVTKYFGGVAALKNLSLSIEKGDLNVIIGPNGSGKTTLFNLITGYLKPTSGHIFCEGMDVTKMDAYKIARLGICRKFQGPNIFGSLNVSDNLRVAAVSEDKVVGLFRGKDESEIKSKLADMLDFVNLNDKKHIIASSLSHGQKQWLEIAITLIKKPKLLLLDEPTSGMTSSETSQTVKLIKDISSIMTCIVIEHDVDFIKAIGGKITVLNRGELLVKG